MDWTLLLENIGQVLVHLLIWILCLVGIAVSTISFSGPWFVAGAALAGVLLLRGPYPGWVTLAVFILLAAGVEVVEFFAGAWGVTKRGGSKWAGVAAVVGGLSGLVLGSFLIPVPVLGSLGGLLLGSFGAAFFVEQRRLKKNNQAAHIAFGAVLARVLVILLKTLLSLGMTFFLLGGIYWSMLGNGREPEVPRPEQEILQPDHGSLENSDTSGTPAPHR